MTDWRHSCYHYIADLPASRRTVLRWSSAILGGSVISALAPIASATHSDDLRTERFSPAPTTHQWGVGLSYGEGQLDLIDLDNSQILHSFSGFYATHAITPLEAQNRFVVHGFRVESSAPNKRRIGVVMAIDIDPISKNWTQVLYRDLPGGIPLHWQPNPSHSEIVFNTIADGALHVLDTKTLTLRAYTGGGSHSNMALFDDLLIATDHLEGPTHLLVTDRNTNETLSRTPVGTWGHGVTVNFQRGEAWVWSAEGVHRISLASSNMGRHLGILAPFQANQRSWFCWTPQGGRYSHDVAWNPGEVYNPYLLVLDMQQGSIETIATEDAELHPSFMQVSPDGKWGLASLQGWDEVGVFDLEANRFKGTVQIGEAEPSFFERDMSFCKNRRYAMATNSDDRAVSLIDLEKLEEVRRIYLPRKPLWFKAISPA